MHNKYDRVAVYLYDNSVTMLNNKGLSLAELGMYNQSIALYDNSLAINSDHVYALNNKNSALESLSKIK
jgi:tetratricopeptide (TPR) repeat protein